MDQQKLTPATISIRWSTIAAAVAGVCLGMVIGAAGIQQVMKYRPIILDMFIDEADAKVCINGFSYEFKPSHPDPALGGGVDILHLVTEPKGEIQYDASSGLEIPRPNGPKACAASE